MNSTGTLPADVGNVVACYTMFQPDIPYFLPPSEVRVQLSAFCGNEIVCSRAGGRVLQELHLHVA